MSRRLFPIVAIVLLTVVSVAQAQDAPPGEPVLVLTEAEINDTFTIPSTAFHSVSDVEVDVQPDGVYITFEVTTLRDGTSNTLGIIAILIDLVQEGRVAYSFYDLLVSSYVDPPSDTTVREIGRLVRTAWQSYVNGHIRGLDLQANNMVLTGALMEEDGIYFFGTGREEPGPGWCIECPRS